MNSFLSAAMGVALLSTGNAFEMPAASAPFNDQKFEGINLNQIRGFLESNDIGLKDVESFLRSNNLQSARPGDIQGFLESNDVGMKDIREFGSQHLPGKYRDRLQKNFQNSPGDRFSGGAGRRGNKADKLEACAAEIVSTCDIGDGIYPLIDSLTSLEEAKAAGEIPPFDADFVKKVKGVFSCVVREIVPELDGDSACAVAFSAGLPHGRHGHKGPHGPRGKGKHVAEKLEACQDAVRPCELSFSVPGLLSKLEALKEAAEGSGERPAFDEEIRAQLQEFRQCLREVGPTLDKQDPCRLAGKDHVNQPGFKDKFHGKKPLFITALGECQEEVSSGCPDLGFDLTALLERLEAIKEDATAGSRPEIPEELKQQLGQARDCLKTIAPDLPQDSACKEAIFPSKGSQYSKTKPWARNARRRRDDGGKDGFAFANFRLKNDN